MELMGRPRAPSSEAEGSRVIALIEIDVQAWKRLRASPGVKELHAFLATSADYL